MCIFQVHGSMVAGIQLRVSMARRQPTFEANPTDPSGSSWSSIGPYLSVIYIYVIIYVALFLWSVLNLQHLCYYLCSIISMVLDLKTHYLCSTVSIVCA